MRQPRAAEAFRLLKGDHGAGVRAARRRTHALLHKGDATAALVVVQEALRNLPDDGQLPPDVHADLRTQLLADRSAALGALAEEIYHGPQPPAGRRPRLRAAGRRGARTGLTGPVVTLGRGALAAVATATAPAGPAHTSTAPGARRPRRPSPSARWPSSSSPWACSPRRSTATADLPGGPPRPGSPPGRPSDIRGYVESGR